MSSYAHASLWIEDWNKANKGKQFKFIPGVEAYFHPDLEQWKRDKLTAEQAALDKKALKKLTAKQQAEFLTKIITTVDANDETDDIEMSNALTVENEDDSKSSKHFNPVNRRHHLVLLPKNQKGLLKIFSAVSSGYINGFYRFPRIDTKILREAAKDGDIIASSACLHPDSELITNQGKLRIVDLVRKINDGEQIQILSYCEEKSCLVFKQVTWAAKTRKDAKLLQIKLKNGQILKLTPDHKVFTDQGWIEAQLLTNKHKVLSIP